MSTLEFEKLIRRDPFSEFALELESGEEIKVSHPNYIAFSESGNVACIFIDSEQGSKFIELNTVKGYKLTGVVKHVEPLPRE